MPKILLAPDQILAEVFEEEEKIGLLWTGRGMDIPAGVPGHKSGSQLPITAAKWYKIIQVGTALEDYVSTGEIKIGARAILHKGYSDVTEFNMSEYTAGDDKRKLAVLEPKYIALMLDYTKEEQDKRLQKLKELEEMTDKQNQNADTIRNRTDEAKPLSEEDAKTFLK